MSPCTRSAPVSDSVQCSTNKWGSPSINSSPTPTADESITDNGRGLALTMVEENIELLDLDPRQSEQESSNSGSDADSESPAGASPHIQAQPLRLKKELTLAHGIAIVTGNIIGSGIFLSPNIVLEYSGSFGLSISLWLLGAIISIVSSLSFIELATFVKDCGGECLHPEGVFVQKEETWLCVFGSLLSFLYTWTSTFILRPAGIAVSTILFARYLIRPLYIGCSIPVYAVKLIALSAIIILAALNSYSVKLYGRIQTLFSSMKLLACAFLFFVGIGFVCSRGAFRPPFITLLREPHILLVEWPLHCLVSSGPTTAGIR